MYVVGGTSCGRELSLILDAELEGMCTERLYTHGLLATVMKKGASDAMEKAELPSILG